MLDLVRKRNFGQFRKNNKMDQNFNFERNPIRDTELLQKLFWTKIWTPYTVCDKYEFLKSQIKTTPQTTSSPLHLKLRIISQGSSPKFNFELTLDQIRNHLKPLD